MNLSPPCLFVLEVRFIFREVWYSHEGANFRELVFSLGSEFRNEYLKHNFLVHLCIGDFGNKAEPNGWISFNNPRVEYSFIK